MPQSGFQSLSPFDVLTTYSPGTATDLPAGAGALGAVGSTPDGRVFRLASVLAGGTSLAANKLMGGPAAYANLNSASTNTASVQAIGDTTMKVTTTSTFTFAANAYAGGLLSVVTGTGFGQTLVIKSHPATTGGTTCVFTLQDPIIIATIATDVVNVVPNAWNGVIIYPHSSPLSQVAGVPLVAVTAQASTGFPVFCWLQTQGSCVVLNDASTAVQLGIQPSSNTDGAVMTNASTHANIGMVYTAATSTDYSFVDLNIA